MPIYEYACGKCDHEFEVEQRITEDPIKTCPQCKSRKVKKLISQTSFVLKGGGWYSDLYSSSNKDSKSDGDAKESGPTDAKGSDKSEKKSGGDDKGKGGKSKGKGKKGSKAAA